MWNSDCYGIDFFQNVTYCKIYYSFIIHPITEVRMRITNLEGYNILLIIMLNNTIELLKLDKKSLKKHPEYQELYLLRVGDNYLPAKHYYINNDVTNEALYDLKYARDVILRILEYRKNGAKSLEKAVFILEEEISIVSESLLSNELLSIAESLNEEYERKRNYDT